MALAVLPLDFEDEARGKALGGVEVFGKGGDGLAVAQRIFLKRLVVGLLYWQTMNVVVVEYHNLVVARQMDVKFGAVAANLIGQSQ